MPVTQVFFIDARVAGYQSLVAGLGPDSPWFLLDAEQNGLAQISRILASFQQLEAISIISHGAPGALLLGSTRLTLDTLKSHVFELQAIGSSLRETGDLLLYGCEVGLGPVGAAFLAELAETTGADVAASTNLTGGVGDWLLEVSTGNIEAQLLDATFLGFTVSLANTAPVLAAASPVLAAITENDANNPGQTVASILGNSLTDTDLGALQGMALFAVTGSGGQWQFMTDAGSGWKNVNLVSQYSALLLRSTDLIRWQPLGTIGTTATLSFYGWDQSSGSAGSKASVAIRGGSSAWSTATNSAQLSVTNVNDAPLWSMGDGKVTTAIGSWDDVATSAVLQPDGKIVVAGYSLTQSSNGRIDDFALARYLPDGRLDPGFSGDGKQTTDFDLGAEQANSVALQTDGKIVLAGSTGSSGRFAVARYNTDGSLDTTFSGDGLLITDPILSTAVSSACSVAVQADGKIVVAGVSANSSGNNDFAVVRYDSSGNLDTSFSSDGKLSTPIGTGHDVASSLVLQPDGKILVAGYSHNGSNNDFAVTRYNTNGSLDTSFSGDGKLTTDFGGTDDYGICMALQADGKILVAGRLGFVYSSALYAVARYNPNGTLDAGFGSGGLVIGAGAQQVSSLAIQSDGKIVLAGSSYVSGQHNFSVWRLLADGSSDQNFSGDGVLATDFYDHDDFANSVHVQADGKILAIGSAQKGLYSTRYKDFALARYNSDGSASNDLSSGPPIFTEGGAAVELDTVAWISDTELSASNNFAGSSLTLARQGGARFDDLFSAWWPIELTQGRSLSVNDIIIGSVTKNSGGTLILSFNSNATPKLLSLVLQSINYANTSDAPPASVQIAWNFNDGNTGSQGSGGALSTTGYTTVRISGVNDALSGTIAITGVLRHGETLTAVASLIDPDGRGTLNYQWRASGQSIDGATGATYLLTQNEVGKTLTVTVSYTDGGGTLESATSAATATVGKFNNAPAGSLTLSGTPAQGQALALTSTLSDLDGTGPITYQWMADGLALSGANARTYVLKQADVGKVFSATASYTDGGGVAESVSSAFTALVVNVNDTPTGTVSIAGTARQGQTLTASHTVADLDGIPASGTGALRWQWYADGTAIALATSSTLTLGQSLVGKTLTAAVGYTDNFGEQESVSSAATAAVVNVNDAPTGLLRVTGTYAQGQVLTASNTLNDLDGLGAINYQWQANGVDLAGAIASTLTLTQAHVGLMVRVKASYTDGQGTAETVFTAGTSVANVNDAPLLTPRGSVFTAIGKDANAGQTMASVLGTSVSDTDVGSLQGVAIHNSSGVGGNWQYSTNAGVSWTSFGTVSSSSALLLRSSDLVRWLSETGQGDPVSFSYYAWDQTVGVAGSKANVTTRGGASAYSTASDSAVSDVVAPGQGMVLQDNLTGVASGTVVFTLLLGEAVQGLSADDFTVSGGSIGTVESLNSKFYQLTVTPTANSAGVLRLALKPDAFKWSDGQASAGLNSEPQYFLTRSTPPEVLTVPKGTVFSSNQAQLVSAVTYGASSYYYVDNGNGADYVRGNALNTGFTDRGLSYTLPSASELSALFKNAYIPTSSGIWPASGNKYWSSTTGYYAGERSYVTLGSLGSNSSGQITSVTGSQNYDAFLAYRVAVEQAIYPVLETTALHEKYTPESTLTFLLHKASATRISVPLSLGGTASLGGDYSLSGNYLLDQGVHYLVFEPGSTLSHLQVKAVNDAVAEGVETLSIGLQAGASIYLSQSTFSLSISGSELSGELGIVGNAQQGQTLTVSNGLKESGANGPTPQIKSLTWLADNLPLSESGTDLLLTQDLVGKTIALRALVSDSRGDEFTVQKGMAAAVVNVNDAPTGGVSISGNLVQGQTLSASHTLADLDGMPSSGAGVLRYQWRADGLAIAGATASTHTLTQAEVGKSLSVLAQYTDLQGSPESVSSAASAAVTNVNDAPTGGLQITGSATQGQVLSISQTLVDLDGIPTTGAGALRYQWNADGADIAGATAQSYTLTQADVGKRLSVSASYVDGFGQPESVSSAATTAVLNVNDAPQGGVFVNGTAVQGRTLTASHTLSDLDGIPASGPGTIAFQWLAGGVAISGATATTFMPTQAEVGKTLRVTASYVDGFGRQESVSSQLSSAVSNLNDPPSGSVSISGMPAQGQTLVASHNLSDPDGIPNSGTGAPRFQWRAAGLDVAGATTASFTLTQAQVGLAMTVAVTYTDASGATEVVSSAATVAVANINDAPTGSVQISGTPTQGQVLSVVNSLVDPDGMANSGTGAPRYQWQANGVDLKGATSVTYGLSQTEVGKTLSVIVSYTDLQGTAETVASPPTEAVANVNDRPSGAVRITGAPIQGQALVASHTVSDLDGIPSSGADAIRYQWTAAAQDIAGATSATFTPTQAEVSKTLYVTVAYTDKYGTAESLRSVATTAVWNVNDPPTGDFSIIGTPVQGQTLRVSHTLADLDGIPASGAGALRYQWLSNGAVIEGATNDSLVLTAAEVDRFIAVTAYYRDELGNFENVSSPNTQTVAKLNEAPVALAGTLSTQRGASLSGTLSASDPDGDALTFLVLSNPAHGTLSVEADTGRYSYQPEPGYVGADGFRYKVSDGQLDSPTVAVDLQVLGESVPVEPKPVFWKDSTKTLSSDKLAEAVSLADAIAILKMIVGLPVNTNNVALSPYQAIAADFDQNGEVELSDAIGVLKMVVGLSAPAPAWKYFDGDKLAVDYKATESLSPKGWSADAALPNLVNVPAEIKMVGVLTGDVDGSWLGS